MWYEIIYEKQFVKVYKVEGGKSEIVFRSRNTKTAERAYYLIEKHGHGAIRYSEKQG